MAIPRLSMKVGKPGAAGAHAAYISRQGEYANRLERGEKLEATEDGNMPRWAMHNAQEFWKASDQYERKNGTTYREMEIALPRELPSEQRIELVREWVAQEIGDRHVYQWAIHNKSAADEGEQPHVHLMFSERQVDEIERDPDLYFKRYTAKQPEKGGARKEYGKVDPALNGKERRAARAAVLKELRGRWGDLCNVHLERAGLSERIDMRSYREQGIDRQPERKMRPSEWREEKAQVIEFRAARRELEAAQSELPNGGAMIIDLQKARLDADRRRRERQQAEELELQLKAEADQHRAELMALLTELEQVCGIALELGFLPSIEKYQRSVSDWLRAPDSCPCTPEQLADMRDKLHAHVEKKQAEEIELQLAQAHYDMGTPELFYTDVESTHDEPELTQELADEAESTPQAEPESESEPEIEHKNCPPRMG